MNNGVGLKIYNGDCLNVLQSYPDNYFDSVVTDPPYGISFMGKKWDYDVPSVELWSEVYRVLKPGAHLLCACGTRTQHRMVVNIEDAGFEIRDIVSWIYGSGFPKSLDVGKAVDKLQGNERKIVDRRDVGHDITSNAYRDGKKERMIRDITVGESEWEGWGTALKPAQELFTLARKPLSEKTVAANVLRWGTGAINIDKCRVPFEEGGTAASNPLVRMSKGIDMRTGIDNKSSSYAIKPERRAMNLKEEGRFPANVIHDGHQLVLDLFPHTKTGAMKKHYEYKDNGQSMGKATGITRSIHEANEGSAARFFYCAKASRSERGENNNHPTVKPIRLMEYLVKLITPPNGIVLDCYAGSGSTGIACQNLGFDCVLIERDEAYCEIINNRVNA